MCINKSFVVPALTAVLGWMLAGRVSAQAFTVLQTLPDGITMEPIGDLVLSGNTLYGQGGSGGRSGYGVFALHTDGTGFRTLFSSSTPSDSGGTSGGLILSEGILYGTAFEGGTNGFWG